MKYNISNLRPRTDISISRYGFSIELDAEFALKLFRVNLKPEYFNRLNEVGKETLDAIFHQLDWQSELFPRRNCFNFWENRCLLTNVNVEPGNACGLDMDHNDFSRIVRGETKHNVRYWPHNVDTLFQAYSLLAIWLDWYNLAEALTK